eukprot:1774728-Prymnesium_polylepis.1
MLLTSCASAAPACASTWKRCLRAVPHAWHVAHLQSEREAVLDPRRDKDAVEVDVVDLRHPVARAGRSSAWRAWARGRAQAS